MKSFQFALSTISLMLFAACSSSDEAMQTNEEKEADRSTTTTSLVYPTSEQEVTSALQEADVQPLEIITASSTGLQAGYVLQTSDTLESALDAFRAQHEEFLDFMRARLEQDVADARTDEDEVTQSMRETLLNDVRIATEEFHSGALKIVRLRLRNQDLDTLKSIMELEPLSQIVKDINDLPSAHVAPGRELLSYSHETWAPYSGTSEVSQYQTYQTFYFNNVTQFTANSASTYEHETQVYNANFANFGGYWASNLPSAYKDTQFLDTLDNFTVGSLQASSLASYTQYYTYMSLTPGSAGSATVRIKGQIGHRWPSGCYSLWCVWADYTTSSMAVFTAPSSLSWQY